MDISLHIANISLSVLPIMISKNSAISVLKYSFVINLFYFPTIYIVAYLHNKINTLFDFHYSSAVKKIIMVTINTNSVTYKKTMG
jgi:hypothetical protein